jgi:hypothetical protein
MKICPKAASNRKGNRGAATLIVLVLLFLMVAFIAGNSANLHSLELELRRVEHLQLRKYQPRPSTNAPAPGLPPLRTPGKSK